MKITASRLSEGNKLFPAEIHIEETGLTVKIPGFLGGKSTFLSYSDISSVSLDAPMIGYSTIKFNAHGEKVTAHGFTKSEVKQVKEAIDNGKRNTNSGSGFPTGANQSGGTTVVQKGDGFLTTGVKTLGGLYGQMLDRTEEIEAEKRLEGKIDDISQMTFGTTADEISNQLNQLTTLGSSKPDKKLKAAIVEKMEFGIMKLKGLGANAEADFFEKKLEPLKKKSWF